MSTTPGPWFIENHGIMDLTRGRTICIFGDSDQDDADLELVALAPTLRDQNVQLRSLVRRFANSWSVTIDVEGYWWWKPDPHVMEPEGGVRGMRRQRFTVDETATYLAVCNEQGVTWPI